MPSVAALLAQMQTNPKSVRFADLERVYHAFFGETRRSGGSHRAYTMPWAGDPRVSIQDFHGEAKPYQVRQVLAAIDRLKEDEK
ncbi:MAG: toxin HicA [Propionibacteriaceae bacterium]|nr:toxin HicA [Propionibacteriaceae bacterium]